MVEICSGAFIIQMLCAIETLDNRRVYNLKEALYKTTVKYDGVRMVDDINPRPLFYPIMSTLKI